MISSIADSMSGLILPAVLPPEQTHMPSLAGYLKSPSVHGCSRPPFFKTRLRRLCEDFVWSSELIIAAR